MKYHWNLFPTKIVQGNHEIKYEDLQNFVIEILYATLRILSYGTFTLRLHFLTFLQDRQPALGNGQAVEFQQHQLSLVWISPSFEKATSSL